MSKGGGTTKLSRTVTSVDVAAESGVSQATVARTFSSPDLVSPRTQAKVREAAERLGYVPNAIARSLKSQRTDIIGAVVPALGEYWQSFITATSRELASRSKQLLLFSFSDPSEVDDVLAAIRQYRLDGLILASASIGQAQMVRVEQTGMNIVAFNQPDALGVIPSVSVDNQAGTEALANHLVSVGVRSAMFVGGVARVSTDLLRYRGAAEAFGASGVACPYLEAGEFSYDAGFKASTKIVEMSDRPDAVMVASDEVAFGLIDGLRMGGLDVPGDILVTGFDGLPQASWAGYDLTTLVQATPVLVEKAVALLLGEHGSEESSEDQLTNDQRNSRDIVVPGTLRFGRTTQSDRSI